ARLDLGRGLRRPKNRQPRLLKLIDNAQRQWLFRPDHRQHDVLFLGESNETVEVILLDRHVDAIERGARIARRAEPLLNLRRLRQLPHQRMFPPALASDEDIHAVRLWRCPGASSLAVSRSIRTSGCLSAKRQVIHHFFSASTYV